MHVLVVPYALIAATGLLVLTASSYTILSGPFGGGALVGTDVLVLATIGAMAGFIALAYGGAKTARLTLGY